MSKVISAIVSTAVKLVTNVLTGANPFSGLASIFFTTLAVSFLAPLLGGKKKSSPLSSVASERKQVLRSAVTPRKIVYGEVLLSGPLVFYTPGGGNHHMVIALAGHEVTSIRQVFFDQDILPPLGLSGGDVTTGKFAGLARVKKHLGEFGQLADTDLITESGGLWTTNHKLQDIAYLYVRIKWNQDVMPNGLPSPRAIVRGRKVFDPRDGQTRWTRNPALVVRDYLTAAFGLNTSPALINDTTVIAAANVCDERVGMNTSFTLIVTADAASDRLTLPAVNTRFDTGDGVRFTSTGTLPAGLLANTTYFVIRSFEETPAQIRVASTVTNAENDVFVDITSAGTGVHTLIHWDQTRYVCDGTLDTSDRPIDIIRQLVSSMVGAVVWSQGKYKVFAGAFSTPTVTLDENDLRDTVKVMARTPRKELFNAVRGVYIEPGKFWEATDYPPVRNSVYVTQDGSEEIFRDVEWPMTINQTRAQRMSKIVLERARQPITVVFPAKLSAFKLEPWDTVQMNIALLGWASKTFRVEGWQLGETGGIDLTLREEVAAVYNWAAGEATVIDPAPDTNLPRFSNVSAPSNLVLVSGNSEVLVAVDGTAIVRIKASWDASADLLLVGYDLQWKRTADTVWNAVTLPASTTSHHLAPAQDGVVYDVRVRALNILNAKSSFISGTHAVTGKNVGTSIPTSLTAVAAVESVKLAWVNPVDNDFDVIEVWENTVDDRATATRVTETKTDFFTRTALAAGATRFFWVRARDRTGNLSDWNALAGVSATALSATVADGSITTTKLANSAVDSTKLADNSVLEAKVAANAISGVKIQDAAITNAKIASLAVDAAKIADASITNVKIANAAIDNAKIANLSVDAAKIADLTVSTIKITNQAATVPVTAKNAANLNLTSTYQTVVSAAISATGAIVSVQASTAWQDQSIGTVNFFFRILRDAVVLFESFGEPRLQNQAGIFSYSLMDTPTAGSHTYALQVRNDANQLSVVKERSITLTELKK